MSDQHYQTDLVAAQRIAPYITPAGIGALGPIIYADYDPVSSLPQAVGPGATVALTFAGTQTLVGMTGNSTEIVVTTAGWYWVNLAMSGTGADAAGVTIRIVVSGVPGWGDLAISATGGAFMGGVAKMIYLPAAATIAASVTCNSGSLTAEVVSAFMQAHFWHA